MHLEARQDRLWLVVLDEGLELAENGLRIGGAAVGAALGQRDQFLDTVVVHHLHRRRANGAFHEIRDFRLEYGGDGQVSPWSGTALFSR